MDTRVVVVVILAFCWKFWPEKTLLKDKLQADYDYVVGRCVSLMHAGLVVEMRGGGGSGEGG